MANSQKSVIKIIVIIIIIIIAIYNYYISKKQQDNYENFETVENTFLQANNSITKEEIEKIKIYITGQVKTNGTIELDAGSRIEDAIILAGGTTNIADLSKINLAYKLEDGQKVYIPSIYENTISEVISTENGENIIEEPYNSGSTLNKKININTATEEKLCSIPGIGESTAKKIISYRNENGNFSSIEDLKNVSGIGNKKFEKIKKFVDIK